MNAITIKPSLKSSIKSKHKHCQPGTERSDVIGRRGRWATGSAHGSLCGKAWVKRWSWWRQAPAADDER